MSAGMLIQAIPMVVPTTPQADLAVAPNFERFDGLGGLDHPAADDPDSGGSRTGSDFGAGPRPGQLNQPEGQVYTPGPLASVVGVLGGQPLPVADCIKRAPGDYTRSQTPSVQQRLGVGQNGPSSLGAQNTVVLSEITNNPPQPGDLASIIAGQA